MKNILSHTYVFIIGIIVLLSGCGPSTQTNWELANKNKDLLRVSTIFTAQNVRDILSRQEGLDSAIAWCKEAGVTRVFIESFRGYTAEKEALLHAKEKFEEAGISISFPQRDLHLDTSRPLEIRVLQSENPAPQTSI